MAIAVEALAIAALVALVALFGPADPEAARAFAEWLGYLVGPIAGFGLCLAGGWLVAKNLTAHHAINGLALGAAVATIDIALLAAGGAGFQLIFLISNLGRLIAGTLGGWLAGQKS